MTNIIQQYTNPSKQTKMTAYYWHYGKYTYVGKKVKSKEVFDWYAAYQELYKLFRNIKSLLSGTKPWAKNSKSCEAEQRSKKAAYKLVHS